MTPALCEITQTFIDVSSFTKAEIKQKPSLYDWHTFVHNQYLTFGHSTWWTQLGFSRMVLKEKSLWANNEKIVGPLILSLEVFFFWHKNYMHAKYASVLQITNTMTLTLS